MKENHTVEAGRIDQPVAALLKDLKQRGMLQDTLVLFTTEFGRTPFAQSAADQVGPGRDHNRYGFSCWMAGAGLKPGFAFGNTDEIGWKAVERPIPWHDFHATILHLFGIDHEQLTFYHNGIQRRLTNVHGEVLHENLSMIASWHRLLSMPTGRSSRDHQSRFTDHLLHNYSYLRDCMRDPTKTRSGHESILEHESLIPSVKAHECDPTH